jgi:hypothetical protein
MLQSPYLMLQIDPLPSIDPNYPQSSDDRSSPERLAPPPRLLTFSCPIVQRHPSPCRAIHPLARGHLARPSHIIMRSSRHPTPYDSSLVPRAGIPH